MKCLLSLKLLEKENESCAERDCERLLRKKAIMQCQAAVDEAFRFKSINSSTWQQLCAMYSNAKHQTVLNGIWERNIKKKILLGNLDKRDEQIAFRLHSFYE